MAVTFDNTVFGANQAETGAIALGAFTGTSLVSGATPVTINGVIDRPSSTVSVDLSVGGVTAVGATGTYLGYSPLANTSDFIYYFSVNGAGITTPVTLGVTGGTLTGLSVLAPVTTTNVTAPVGPNTPPCFVTGTLIRTAGGDVPVEQLAVGDLVVTAGGAQAPIRWIGHRRVACDRHRDPHAVWPVRVLAGAFGDGLPCRDLWLSPDHAVCLDDAALIPVKHLVNGATIAQVPQDAVTYWHVELDRHDILFAEGLPAESFLDTGVRSGFENGAGVIELHPDFTARTHADFCRPLVQDGPLVAEVRARLAARADVLGWTVTRDPGLHLVADGTVIRPVVTGDVVEFRVPSSTRELRLVSRTFAPYLLDPRTGDRRQLGVPLRGLALRDEAGFTRTVAIDDAAFDAGFSFVQGQDADRWRWTDGDAVLPADLWAGARGELSLRVTLVPASHWAGDGVYAFSAPVFMPALERQVMAAENLAAEVMAAEVLAA